ncbi:hypothetical protein RFI_17776, partial [Reticulomyxa filosa]
LGGLADINSIELSAIYYQLFANEQGKFKDKQVRRAAALDGMIKEKLVKRKDPWECIQGFLLAYAIEKILLHKILYKSLASKLVSFFFSPPPFSPFKRNRSFVVVVVVVVRTKLKICPTQNFKTISKNQIESLKKFCKIICCCCCCCWETYTTHLQKANLRSMETLEKHRHETSVKLPKKNEIILKIWEDNIHLRWNHAPNASCYILHLHANTINKFPTRFDYTALVPSHICVDDVLCYKTDCGGKCVKAEGKLSCGAIYCSSNNNNNNNKNAHLYQCQLCSSVQCLECVQ